TGGWSLLLSVLPFTFYPMFADSKWLRAFRGTQSPPEPTTASPLPLGWSLLVTCLPFTFYPMFADSKWLGPFRGTQSTLEQTTAYHMLSGESLLGIPVQAFADTVIGFLVFGTALMMTGAGK